LVTREHDIFFRQEDKAQARKRRATAAASTSGAITDHLVATTAQATTMASTDKYDRQLRLWGAAGQRALAESTVVLVRATAVGTETLKNLILPGIGRYICLDDAATVKDDYASNFFVTIDTGKCRAEETCENLQELNPDVRGSWKHVEEGLESLDFAAFLGSIQNALVVGSDLEPALLEKVATACEVKGVPMLAVFSYGLTGILRLQCPPTALLNPKPRSEPPDLRLVHPFPALQALSDGIDLAQLDNKDHGHVPYPILLMKLAGQWKGNHAGKLPVTFQEKQEFVATIKAAARNYEQEINFHEAVSNAYTAYAAREVDREHLARLKRIAAASSTASTTSASTPSLRTFSQLLAALDAFLQRHSGQPPVKGTIPDMHASTQLYVDLQKAYLQQADADLAEFKSLMLPAAGSIDDDTIKTFCQNVFTVDVLQTRTLAEEYCGETAPDDICEDLAMSTMEGDEERPDQTAMLFYLAFRGCQLFHSRYGRYPGTVENYQQDVVPLHQCITQIVAKYKLRENDLIMDTLLKINSATDTNDYAAEMTRYGNAELHNVASVIGGVASQEAVKLITGQYVPLNNTYVYNGIASTAGVYKF
jgi:amyloid beta precursor protein binding protein 1